MTIDFTHEGRTYDGWTVEQALAAGIPPAIIDAALAAQRRSLIKAECRRRIYAAASAETQMNMAAATAVISAKTASNRSQAEQDTLAGVQDALAWVAAMRANVATLAADPQADFTADAAWPDIPATAAAVAQQF
jgi:hypothetical protein